MPTKTHRTHTKRYARRAHSVCALHAHLVFVVKYRRRVITERVFDTLKRAMRASAHHLGCSLNAIESDGDHLHVLITYPPSLSIAKMVQHLKGASSRMVRAQRLPEVLRTLWGRHFWSPSYCVVSCGGAPLDIVKTYVDTQRMRSQKRSHTPTKPMATHGPQQRHGSHRSTAIRTRAKPPPVSPH